MLRLTVACVIVFGVWIGAVGAAAPKLTVSVKTLSPTSPVVRIVNRDQVTYREFLSSRPKRRGLPRRPRRTSHVLC